MARQTKELINGIKKFYNVENLKKLTFEQWKQISGEHPEWQYKLTEEFIDMYADKLFWNFLIMEQTLPPRLIDKYFRRKISWSKEFVSLLVNYQKLSVDFIEKYINYLEPSWDDVLRYQDLSEDFIEEYCNEDDWFVLAVHQKLSSGFLDENVQYLDSLLLWNDIANYQELEYEFMEKYIDKFNFNVLVKNQKLTDSEINTLMKNIKDISRIKDISPFIVKKYFKFEGISDILKYYSVYKKLPEDKLEKEILKITKNKKEWEKYLNGFSDRKIAEIKFIEAVDFIKNKLKLNNFLPKKISLQNPEI